MARKNTFFLFELAGDDANADKLAELLGVDPSNDNQPRTEAQIEEATQTWAGKSLLHQAAQRRATECVKILGKAGAAQNEEDKFLLSYAIRGKVRTLLFIIIFELNTSVFTLAGANKCFSLVIMIFPAGRGCYLSQGTFSDYWAG